MAFYHCNKNLMYPVVSTGVKGPTSPTDFGAHWPDHFPIAPMVLRMFRTSYASKAMLARTVEGHRVWESAGVSLLKLMIKQIWQ